MNKANLHRSFSSIVMILFCWSCAWSQSNIKVNQPAPPITISHWIANVPDNKSLEGKFIVLEFWATWCGPCIAAVPHMNELQDRFKRDDLRFISITDESEDKIKTALKRINFKSIVATDLSKKTQIQFGNGSTGLDVYPLTVLIDNKGTIKWIGEPMALNEAIMEKFLKNEPVESGFLNETKASSAKKAKSFNDLLKDRSNSYYFQLTESTVAERSFNALNKRMYGIGYMTISEIFAEVLNKVWVEVPMELQQTKFDLLYRNNQTATSLDKLEQEMLDQLKLKKSIAKREVQTYNVEVEKESLLEPAADKSFSSKSDAGDKLIFTNTSISDVLKEMEKVHKVIFRLSSDNQDSYDFIIDISSLSATLKSLNSYGLKAQKSIQLVDMLVLQFKVDQ
ncbi:MAG: TlpA family protein disulfide reductase [Chitinophagaceae bacterium]